MARKDIKLLYEEVNILIFEAMFRSFYDLTCATSGDEAIALIHNNPEI